MTKPFSRSPITPISLAVFTALCLPSSYSFAQEGDQEEAIEEVVATGTRLKGTATAVLEERKNQAFVADILGAEQISRTGDGDAAAALRRVTGLTLVDGRFIYVRGLGERYSSTRLNGASVPSPDPTRSVIPLDLFPSDIIESLSVQKSFSPSMPAAFGGGNVDIRLKSIPTQLVFNLSGNLGTNTENFDDAYQYSGGGRDWLGEDDGTRAAPASIVALWDSKQFLDNISPEEARSILKDVHKDYDPVLRSVDPDFGFNLSLGNSFDLNDDIRYGFLITAGYDNSWQVSEGFIGEEAQRSGELISFPRFFDEVDVTEHQVRFSGMLNVGVDYKRNHRIDFSTIALNDTRDQIRELVGNSNNIQISDGNRIRDVDVVYEERQLWSNQIRGKHTFTDLNFLGFDWQYTESRSSRNAPGNISTRFILSDLNEDGLFDKQSESSLTNATTAARYQFQTLSDRVENLSWNVNYPMTIERFEMEFKVGADFVSKARTAENRRFDVNTRGFANSSILLGNNYNTILSDANLAGAELSSVPLLSDTTIAGDDYVAAQKIDAYYVEADVFFNQVWRISGGVRWEDYRQAVVPLDPRTNQFDLPDEADRSQLAFQESEFYPAVAITYILSDKVQFRASYGQTVVRPDTRELASSTYIDPLTDFPTGGTPGLRTTQIKNYDFRWEWYLEEGDNLSVAVFYKDMDSPIESVQSPAQDGPPLVRIANAESGELLGVEVEFLKGLGFIGEGQWDNFFVSGNVTLSDSEIQLNGQNVVEQTGVSTSVTNLKRRLTGHSEYVLNLQMGYDSDNGEHSASLVYNVFGERILIPGIDGFDDSYEQPFHSLDLVYTYFPDFNTTVKFRVQNLLGEDRELQFEDTVLRAETRGTGFSLSYKYEF